VCCVKIPTKRKKNSEPDFLKLYLVNQNKLSKNQNATDVVPPQGHLMLKRRDEQYNSHLLSTKQRHPFFK